MAFASTEAKLRRTVGYAAAEPHTPDNRVSNNSDSHLLPNASALQPRVDASNRTDTYGAFIEEGTMPRGRTLRNNRPQRGRSPASALAGLQGGEPGFYVTQRALPCEELEGLLFEQPDDALLKHFRTLNPHLSPYAKAGQLVVLSDPLKSGWRAEETVLRQVAANVDDVIQQMTDEETAFMVRHQLQIQSFLTQGQGTLGEVIFSKHLDHIQSLLGQLEEMHPRIYQPQKGLNIQEFFSIRKDLLTQFHQSLGPLVMKSAGVPEALKTSIRELDGLGSVHHWSKAGAPGDLTGYATHICSVARACSFLKAGGWMGIGLRDNSAARKISALCRIGREGECHPVDLLDSRVFGVELNGPPKVRAEAEVGVWVALGLDTDRLACALVISKGLTTSGQVDAEQIYKVSL